METVYMTERSKILIYNSVSSCRNLNSTWAIVLSIFLYSEQTVIGIGKIQTIFFCIYFLAYTAFVPLLLGPDLTQVLPALIMDAKEKQNPRIEFQRRRLAESLAICSRQTCAIMICLWEACFPSFFVGQLLIPSTDWLVINDGLHNANRVYN